MFRLRRYNLAAAYHEVRYRRRRSKPAGPPLMSGSGMPLVSIVCVTNRPDFHPHVMSNYASQTWPKTELILVANCDRYPDPAFTTPGLTFVTKASTTSLGECLNAGFDLARGEIIARMDDDDLYATTYVSDVVHAFGTCGASITGKFERYAYVEEFDATYLLYEGRGSRFVGRATGGSMAVLRSCTRAIRFPDSSLGEDLEYIRRCERAGLRVWATDPKGFLQMRRTSGGAHTWAISNSEFVRDARRIGRGHDESIWV